MLVVQEENRRSMNDFRLIVMQERHMARPANEPFLASTRQNSLTLPLPFSFEHAAFVDLSR